MNIYLLYANMAHPNSWPHVYDTIVMEQIWDYYNFYKVCDLFEETVVDNSLIILERNYLPDLVSEQNKKTTAEIRQSSNKKIIVLYHYKCLSTESAKEGLKHDKTILVDILGYKPKDIMYITQIKSDIQIVKNQFGNDVKVTYFEKWLEELNRYQMKKSLIQKKSHLEKNPNKPDKKFSLLIRRYEDIRLEVMCELVSKNLLSDFYYTFAARGGHLPEGDVGADIARYINNLPERYEPYRQQIIEWAKGIPYEAEYIAPGENDIYNNLFTTKLNDYYNNSKINLVLETHFHDSSFSRSDFSIITEKTYKAMFYKKPFIILSQSNTLRVLKECGYKTFGHVIDESYDSMKTVPERLNAISNELIRIRNLDDKSFQYLIDSCQENIEHNYNLMIRESFRTIPEEFNIRNFINS